MTYASRGIYALAPAQSGGLYHLLDRVQSTAESETATGNTIMATNTLDGVGNVTQVSTTATAVNPITTKVVRDASGQVIQSYDAMQTSGAHPGSTTLSYSPASIPGCNFSSVSGLPTSMTDALGHTVRVGDDSIGQRNCIQDASGNVTRISYDVMGRVSQVVRPPGGGQTSATYTSSTPIRENLTTTADPDPSRTESTVLDGLGRPVQHTYATGSGTVCEETFYDAAGRVSAVNNPLFSCAGSPSAGVSTSYNYDALDRKVQATLPDGSTRQWSYSGTTVQSTDEAGHQLTHTNDALGRLSTVSEPGANGIASVPTTYTYDGLTTSSGSRNPGPPGRLQEIATSAMTASSVC